jgi:RHS repeat-associated protein
VYDPYGAVTFLQGNATGQTQWSPTVVAGHAAGTASAADNDILYAGYRYDPETSLYQLRNRQYDPSTGRFLQRDPSGYNGTMNPYGYCGGNPVTASDPMGLATVGPARYYVEFGGRSAPNHSLSEALKKYGGNIPEKALVDLELTEDELGKIFAAGGYDNFNWRTKDNLTARLLAQARTDYPGLSGEEQRLAEAHDENVLTAKIILRLSGTGFVSGINDFYATAATVNPVHFAFEHGWEMGSGENLLGQRVDPAQALEETVYYLIAAEILGVFGKLNNLATRNLTRDLATIQAEMRSSLSMNLVLSDGDALATSSYASGEAQVTKLYHYTNEKGLAGILESGELRPSLKAINPNDVRYGNGQYLTDIVPGTRTPSELSYDFLRNPFQGGRYTHYVEIDASGLNIIQGRPGVFVVPNEGPLDLTGRILSNGKVVNP